MNKILYMDNNKNKPNQKGKRTEILSQTDDYTEKDLNIWIKNWDAMISDII